MADTIPVFPNISDTIFNLYESNDLMALKSCLEQYLEEEKAWTASGASDGFYLFSLVKACASRAMEEQNTDMTSFLLSFQNRHFDADFLAAAEDNEMDLAFGLRERPCIYYSPGSELEFGFYTQSALPGAPAAPLQWTVLAQEADRALILAKYGVDVKPYHRDLTDITWAECSLRQWLNADFLQDAFSPEEQERILQVNNHTQDTSSYIKGGSDAQDRIFLLSKEEVASFGTDSRALKKKPTAFAQKAGAALGKNGCCQWFLRTPGNMWMSAACIDSDGQLNDRGVYVQDGHCCICPALWITIPT